MWQVLQIEQRWAVALAGLLGLAAGWGLSVLARVLPARLERAWQAEVQAQIQIQAQDRVHQGQVQDHAQTQAQDQAQVQNQSQIQDQNQVRPQLQPVDVEQAISVAAAENRYGGIRAGAMTLLTALVFAACVWRLGATPAALCGMALAAALIVLAWIDAETGLLPDVLTLLLLWLGLLVNLHGALAPLPQAVLGAAVGYLFPWAVHHLFRWRTGLDGMGYGDFKLMAALGAWFGLEALPWLLLGAALAASAVGLGLRLAGRLRRGQSFPFGPYLAAGGILMLLAGLPMLHMAAAR